ncbi:MAG TPA: ABC transporter permease [Vicinamibacterales bacterium]|jgi:predicted permease
MSIPPILRRFTRAPMFTAIALMTLAIGIGANTAVFSVVNGVIIKPLPYPHSEELVGVWHSAPGAGFKDGNVNMSPTMAFTYREEGRAFQDVGLWSIGGVTVTGLSEPEQVRTLWVTDGILRSLGVAPVLGRWFSREDDTPGTPETVVLMYGYWQRRLGGDPGVIGRAITIDSRPRAVIGVMPASFTFLDTNGELILPHRFDRGRVFLGNFSFNGIARLKPGVTVQQANADVGRMLPIWLTSWPVPFGLDRKLFENARLAPALRPLKQDVIGNVTDVLWVLMGTMGVVLLIACANVANLLLVRVEGRQQELATRAALGAGWRRIARELLHESLLLGAMGGVIGLGVAWGALRLIKVLRPETLPRLDEITIDPIVLAFTVVASLLAGLLFGIIPVSKYSGPRVVSALRGSRTSSDSRERHRARSLLVVTQVALALVLLIASGLMIRTFQSLRNVQPGFSGPAQLQMLRVSIPETMIADPERVARLHKEILDAVTAVPGVTSAAVASSLPLEGFNSNDPVVAQDKVYASGQIPPIRRFKFVSPGYFRTVGTPIMTGRDLDWADVFEDHRVAVISENMAREMWGEPGAALGKQIRVASVDSWREVVGVVGDVYDNGVHEPAPAIVYWPMMMSRFWGNERFVSRSLTFALRSDRTATEPFLAQLRQAVWSVNGGLPLAFVRTMQDVYDRSMARTSFALVMLAIAGTMALLLGVIGIYGVMSYSVSQRTREIGIRMALGVEQRDLRRMFVRYGFVLSIIGVAVGLGVAAGLTRLMASMLFRVSPLDLVTYGAVSLVLLIAAILASYVPARRAASLNPIAALRAE